MNKQSHGSESCFAIREQELRRATWWLGAMLIVVFIFLMVYEINWWIEQSGGIEAWVARVS